jgi:hypothetical protein
LLRNADIPLRSLGIFSKTPSYRNASSKCLVSFSQISFKTQNDMQLLLYLYFTLKIALHNSLLKMSITPKAQGK